MGDKDIPKHADAVPAHKGGRPQKSKYHWVSDEQLSKGGAGVHKNAGSHQYSMKHFSHTARTVVLAAAVFFVFVCAACFFWRDTVILVFGAKNYYGLIEAQNLRPRLEMLTGAMTASNQTVYNSYDISGKVQVSGTDTGLPKTYGGFSLDASKLFTDSTFEIKLGEVIQSKSVAADFNWQYQGDNLLAGQGYINKDVAVINSPELLKQSIYLKSGDYPVAKPLFDLSSQLCTQPHKSSIDGSALSQAMKGIFSKACSALDSSSVKILRNKTGIVGNQTVKCDEIELKLTQAQARKVMHAALDDANRDNTIQALIKLYKPYLDALSAVNKNSGEQGAIEYSYSGLSKAIDNFKTGNVTMMLLVKDGVFGSEVLSRSIKTDTGFAYSNACINGSGNATLQRLDDKDGDVNEIKMAYTDSAASLSGSITTIKASSQANKAADKIDFTISKKVKTGPYLPTFKINVTSLTSDASNGSGKGFSLQTTPAGNKTKVVYEKLSGGKAQLTLTATIAGSSEILKIPDFDKSNVIDPISDKDKLNSLANDYGTNLNAIAQKLGLSRG